MMLTESLRADLAQALLGEGRIFAQQEGAEVQLLLTLPGFRYLRRRSDAWAGLWPGAPEPVQHPPLGGLTLVLAGETIFFTTQGARPVWSLPMSEFSPDPWRRHAEQLAVWRDEARRRFTQTAP